MCKKAVERIQRVAHMALVRVQTRNDDGLRWHDPISVVGAPSRSFAMASSHRLGAGAVASATRPTVFLQQPSGLARGSRASEIAV